MVKKFLGSSSKNTTPFQSHQTNSIIFFWCSSAFDVVCDGSSRWSWSFSNDVILNNRFFITSDNLFDKKGSNSLRLRWKSQALMRFVKWISFNSCGIQISSFLTSPRRCLWRSIDDFDIFNISSISRTVTWRFDSIMALIWSSSTLFGLPELYSSLNEKFPERNLSNQFRHCLSFKASSRYTSRKFSAARAAFFLLWK